MVGIGLTAGQRDELETAGADIVLDDVGELDLGSSLSDPWRFVYHGFDPVHEGHREALTVLGNGYMATRGAHPECRDDGTHYPGTYLAGIFTRHLTEPRFEVADRAGADIPRCEVETSQSRWRIAIALRTDVTPGVLAERHDPEIAGRTCQRRYDLDLRDGEDVVFDKTVAVVTSRDVAISSAVLGAAAELRRNPVGVRGLLPAHAAS